MKWKWKWNEISDKRLADYVAVLLLIVTILGITLMIWTLNIRTEAIGFNIILPAITIIVASLTFIYSWISKQHRVMLIAIATMAFILSLTSVYSGLQMDGKILDIKTKMGKMEKTIKDLTPKENKVEEHQK